MHAGLQIAKLLRANERGAAERLCDALSDAERSRTLGEALWWTANWGDEPLDSLKWFLERGADPNTRDIPPPTAAHIMPSTSVLEETVQYVEADAVLRVQMLLDYGATVEKSPLALLHCILTMQITIAHQGGIFPDEEDYAGAVRLLLAHGADPNAANGAGETALYHAVLSYHPPGTDPLQALVPLLLAHGADPLQPTRKGYTPLDIARLHDDTLSVERMLAAVRERGRQE